MLSELNLGKNFIKHPMIMSHRKSKGFSPSSGCGNEFTDPTIEPAKMSPRPKFLVYQVLWGGFLTFDLVGLIGQGIY